MSQHFFLYNCCTSLFFRPSNGSPLIFSLSYHFVHHTVLAFDRSFIAVIKHKLFLLMLYVSVGSVKCVTIVFMNVVMNGVA